VTAGLVRRYNLRFCSEIPYYDAEILVFGFSLLWLALV
jgi:hypothetical protein